MLDFRICNQCRASHRARIPRLYSNLKKKVLYFLTTAIDLTLNGSCSFSFTALAWYSHNFRTAGPCFSHFWSCQCNSQSFKWLTTRAQSTGQFDATKLAFELTKREIRSFFCSWTVYFMKARSGSFNLNHYCFF